MLHVVSLELAQAAGPQASLPPIMEIVAVPAAHAPVYTVISLMSAEASVAAHSNESIHMKIIFANEICD